MVEYQPLPTFLNNHGGLLKPIHAPNMSGIETKPREVEFDKG